MNSFEFIVASFINKSFELGEWLLKENLISKDDLDSFEQCVIIGIPSLAILHCIEKSSNFDDNKIYLSIDKIIDPNDRKFNEETKFILRKMVKGIEAYKQIEFNYDSYDNFKKFIILNFKNNLDVNKKEKELFCILSEISLLISQNHEYKQKFSNVIDILKTLNF